MKLRVGSYLELSDSRFERRFTIMTSVAWHAADLLVSRVKTTIFSTSEDRCAPGPSLLMIVSAC